jgi:penicillin-binding protein 2
MVWREEDKFSYRVFLRKHNTVFVLLVFLFFCLSVRLFYLQIIKGGDYRKISEQQRIHNTYERAPRGIIYSADGSVLVENKFAYVALFYPFKHCRVPPAEIIEELSEILGRDIKPSVVRDCRYGKALKLADNLSVEEMFKIRERKLSLEGVSVAKEPCRIYCCPKAASHVTGYLSEIEADEIEELSEYGYKMGDYIGRGGIEQFYDKYLHGKDGGWQVEVNARGYQVKEFKYVQPQMGASVYSTIDLKLQKVAYTALKNSESARGAVIILDVKTGAVKALVSCPGFDTNKAGTKSFGRYLKDKRLPLFNRTVQALYPPGSVFKIITFAAAVELLDVSSEKTVWCAGSFKLGDRNYSCWHKTGHGNLDLISAMAQSCNVYFYRLGLKLGIKNLEEYAKKFHLGEKVGVDLPNEKRGFVPSPEWKKLKLKASWFQGDTLVLAIGQGALWVTPLQMACMMSAVANRGVLHKPYIVDRIVDFSGAQVYKHEPELVCRIDLSDKTWDLLHKALLETVENGTAIRSRLSGVEIAGKTGTAQNSQGKDHAWFVSFAPADSPEIAVAVIVENGGGGGLNAVPIGRKIYEAYFNKSADITKEKDNDLSEKLF